MQNSYKDFSIKVLIFFGILFIGYICYLLGSFLFVLFFSVLLAVIFAPFLNFFNKYKIPDVVGIIIIYLIILGFLLLTFFAVIPIFVKNIIILVDKFSDAIVQWQMMYEQKGIDGLPLPQFLITYLGDFLQNFDFSSLFTYLRENFAGISKSLAGNIRSFAFISIGFFASIAGSVITIILIIIFNFFLVLERRNVKSFFYEILPYKVSRYLQKREEEIINCFANWLKGMCILAFAMFFMTFIGLFLIKFIGVDIQEKFALSLIAGLMEFVPYIGPLLALLPALAVSITMGIKAIIVIIILYIIIQQIEGNVLVPLVMGKTMNLSPFFVLLMMTLGGSLYGIIGIILALPLAAVLQIFVKDFLEFKKSRENLLYATNEKKKVKKIVKKKKGKK